jgi:two-component system, response regulator PdtaR
MLSSERVLIIEEVFLIALDIQRILEDAGVRQTVLARNFQEAATLADRFGEFDLAVIHSPRPGTADIEVASRLAAAVPALVVCSADPQALAHSPLGAVVKLSKPFSDGQLLAACGRAIERRDAR